MLQASRLSDLHRLWPRAILDLGGNRQRLTSIEYEMYVCMYVCCRATTLMLPKQRGSLRQTLLLLLLLLTMYYTLVLLPTEKVLHTHTHIII